MAMEATELMVGDLVNIKGKPVKVTLDDLKTMLILFEDVDFHIEPIELTSEILVKNGFEKQEDANEWSYYKSKDGKGQYMILWSMDYNYLEIGSYTEEFGEFNRMGIMRYVHQLQHALRLCGIDKELTI